MKKKILLVTSSFPPEQSGGVGRPYSLYKYLPKSNIEVHVITTNIAASSDEDSHIFRYDTFANWRALPLFSTKRLKKYWNAFLSRSFSIISDQWWITQVKKNKSNLLTNDYDLIYITFPLPETFVIGLYLKKMLKLPLIVEFRDGLCFESIIRNPNLIQRYKMRKLESSIVDSAECVITIGNVLSEYFKTTYEGKVVHTVHNGFDPDDFLEDRVLKIENKDSDTTRIVFFGRLSNSRQNIAIETIFRAFANVFENTNRQLSLDMIGDFTSHEKQAVEKYSLQAVVNFYPAVEKKLGLSKLRAYDYLLFVGSEGEKTVISAKLLEYINLGVPILGICQGNEAEQIIKYTGTGEVSGFDFESIKILFQKAVNKQVKFAPDFQKISLFSREAQAGAIAEIIKSVLK